MAVFDIKSVVTDVDANGKAVFSSVGPPRSAEAGGMNISNVWGTADDGSVTVGRDGTAEPTFVPFFPAGTGTRFCVVEFPPASAGHSNEDGPDPEETQPGLIGAFEVDNPGTHTTESIDYGICLSGEIYLELDNGVEEKIAPGTVVVQRGTRHAWRNKSDDICTMIFVLCGAAWAN